jgi:mannose-6-phosphate isomerase
VIRLANPVQHYAWGSPTAIPELLGLPATSRPVAESWMGAHPSAPSQVRTGDGQLGLDAWIRADAGRLLGQDVVARFGAVLPYLLKIIAAERPLSMQVHPTIGQARSGYAAEQVAGIPVGAPHRNYRDRNHKPELVYALTRFEALCGFRSPRRAAELLFGLEVSVAKQLHDILANEPTGTGIRAAFAGLLTSPLRPTPAEVGDLAAACAARLHDGSPSPEADRIVVSLAAAYPGDPGVVTSLLLNAVTLQPGEAMFVPAGRVHAYLRGTAMEVMASSDNVLRAGLTPKHVDVDELLRLVDYAAGPPTLIAPELFHSATRIFAAPVDDFEFSVTTVVDGGTHPLPGRGPRVLLCLDGSVTLTGGAGAVSLHRGETVFAPASDGAIVAHGLGTLVQASAF